MIEWDYIQTNALNRRVVVVDCLGARLELVHELVHDGARLIACLNHDSQDHNLSSALIIIVSPDQSERVELFGWWVTGRMWCDLYLAVWVDSRQCEALIYPLSANIGHLLHFSIQTARVHITGIKCVIQSRRREAWCQDYDVMWTGSGEWDTVQNFIGAVDWNWAARAVWDDHS